MEKRPAVCGRFAPSPSGRMHLGNLCCCLLAWLSAKSKGGSVVLRVEDLDAMRCPAALPTAGGGPGLAGAFRRRGRQQGRSHAPYYQSERSNLYQQYYDKLAAMGLTYPCFCTRSQLHAASAPHRSDGQVVYQGTCRSLTPGGKLPQKSAIRPPAWRVQVPDKVVAFTDGHMGRYGENLAADCGDFIVRAL